MLGMQFNKPRFNWDAKDRLLELEQFRQECNVLFQGPLSEMKDPQKAGLIVNWIGRQCTMTPHSMSVTLDKPDTVFEMLESIFRPESKQTLSRFKFRSLKQKQLQNCDAYMAELRLNIVECKYPNMVQDELLKEQFIFGVCIKEVQDHLLDEITPEDNLDKCLLEARKIENKIEQCKLLGIKTGMTYDAIHSNNKGRSQSRNKNQGWAQSQSSIRNCKYCGKIHNCGNCPAFGKECIKCSKKNHFKSVCKAGSSNNDKCNHSRSRSKKKKGKKFHEINESENSNDMEDLQEQVQSLFYHDVHFNNVNTRMHTELQCENKSRNKSKQVFKIDTGANGNLIPITMFSKLHPNISLNALSSTIEKGMTLYAYNNMPIKQYGICSVKISFKSKQEICKFYVVEHATVILGVSDSEKLGLVKVNFDAIKSEKTVRLVHAVDQVSDDLKSEIESEFPALFKGIGCMEGEISIKLKKGTIPHVEPIRHVPHTMQDPLKSELDKLCKEGILHKVDISEPIE